jgi:hypothetical protein
LWWLWFDFSEIKSGWNPGKRGNVSPRDDETAVSRPETKKMKKTLSKVLRCFIAFGFPPA